MALKYKMRTTVFSVVLAAGLGLCGNRIMSAAAEPGTVSAGDEIVSEAFFQETVSSGEEARGAGISSSVEITAPIYNYDVLDVVVPASYLVAFNPYRLKIGTGDGGVSDAQVVSRNYGIVNKSTRDKVVTVVLTVEDLNGGQIVFADSAEEALQAGEGVYAVYLALVPAGEGEILADGRKIDEGITAEGLAEVSMEKAPEHAVSLKAGENRVAFLLSGAEYVFSGGGDGAGSFELAGLAPDGSGIAAFTFDGVMNPSADWTKLTEGIRISVVYSYENTIGEGTGACVDRKRP